MVEEGEVVVDETKSGVEEGEVVSSEVKDDVPSKLSKAEDVKVEEPDEEPKKKRKKLRVGASEEGEDEDVKPKATQKEEEEEEEEEMTIKTKRGRRKDQKDDEEDKKKSKSDKLKRREEQEEEEEEEDEDGKRRSRLNEEKKSKRRDEEGEEKKPSRDDEDDEADDEEEEQTNKKGKKKLRKPRSLAIDTSNLDNDDEEGTDPRSTRSQISKKQRFGDDDGDDDDGDNKIKKRRKSRNDQTGPARAAKKRAADMMTKPKTPIGSAPLAIEAGNEKSRMTGRMTKKPESDEDGENITATPPLPAPTALAGVASVDVWNAKMEELKTALVAMRARKREDLPVAPLKLTLRQPRRSSLSVRGLPFLIHALSSYDESLNVTVTSSNGKSQSSGSGNIDNAILDQQMSAVDTLQVQNASSNSHDASLNAHIPAVGFSELSPQVAHPPSVEASNGPLANELTSSEAPSNQSVHRANQSSDGVSNGHFSPGFDARERNGQALYYRPADAPKWRTEEEWTIDNKQALLSLLRKRHLVEHNRARLGYEEVACLSRKWKILKEQQRLISEAQAQDQKHRYPSRKNPAAVAVELGQEHGAAEQARREKERRKNAAILPDMEPRELYLASVFDRKQLLSLDGRPAMCTVRGHANKQCIASHHSVPSLTIPSPLGCNCARAVSQCENITLWTDAEKALFLDKFLQFPKDFQRIARYFDGKTTAECIAFYYDTKKQCDYKQYLAEHYRKRNREGGELSQVREAFLQKLGVKLPLVAEMDACTPVEYFKSQHEEANLPVLKPPFVILSRVDVFPKVGATDPKSDVFPRPAVVCEQRTRIDMGDLFNWASYKA